MVELFSRDEKGQDRQSSKGNQLKWCSGGIWYKADYLGYEGLAEYVVSRLLERSDLPSGSFVRYETEEIFYRGRRYLGCRCADFLHEGEQLITLERLFQNRYGISLYETIYKIPEVKERASFLVDTVERLTGLKDFGIYLQRMLTIDGFFLNEDRHMHNIAVIMDEQLKYRLCPFFDQGAALLSDTRGDYPMENELDKLLSMAESKTLCADFDGQMDAVDELYGLHLSFCFGEKTVEEILRSEPYYPEDVKQRIFDILAVQRRKYDALFR